MKTITLFATAATLAAGIGTAQAQSAVPNVFTPVDAAIGTAGAAVSTVTGGALRTGRSVGFDRGYGDRSVDSNGLRPFVNGVF